MRYRMSDWVLAENVRWLLDQGVHRERIAKAVGRSSIAALERELYRIGEPALAREIHADPTPAAVNARTFAPFTRAQAHRLG